MLTRVVLLVGILVFGGQVLAFGQDCYRFTGQTETCALPPAGEQFCVGNCNFDNMAGVWFCVDNDDMEQTENLNEHDIWDGVVQDVNGDYYPSTIYSILCSDYAECHCPLVNGNRKCVVDLSTHLSLRKDIAVLDINSPCDEQQQQP